jgi:hypothetical protein
MVTKAQQKWIDEQTAILKKETGKPPLKRFQRRRWRDKTSDPIGLPDEPKSPPGK